MHQPLTAHQPLLCSSSRPLQWGLGRRDEGTGQRQLGQEGMWVRGRERPSHKASAASCRGSWGWQALLTQIFSSIRSLLTTGQPTPPLRRHFLTLRFLIASEWLHTESEAFPFEASSLSDSIVTPLWAEADCRHTDRALILFLYFITHAISSAELQIDASPIFLRYFDSVIIHIIVPPDYQLKPIFIERHIFDAAVRHRPLSEISIEYQKWGLLHWYWLADEFQAES